MGGNGLILFLIIVEFLQLTQPVDHGDHTDGHKQPIDRIGCPPVLHEPEKIVWPEQVIDE
jgi:PIN domain nuclease of toxin-antitoxin system